VPASKKPPKKPAASASKAAKAPAHKNSAQPMDRMALLAHQLRTPLSTVTSLSQGLMRRADRMSVEDIRTRAEKIWRASLRVDELIKTIMSYTRLNTDAITLNRSSFDLQALVRRVCDDQSRHEPSRPFNVALQNVPSSFVGDPVLLEQALIIILSNAMKYSPPEGPINITGQTSDGIISLSIEDQGIGVPERDLPFLMQPFFRGRNVRNIPGTGLGLSLAWHILRLHDGSLQVKSREGHGTTITMMLPENDMSGFGNNI